MFIVFVLDIRDFIKYLNDNPNESGWTNFNCYVQILVNSSNLKTCFTGLLFIQLFEPNVLDSGHGDQNIDSEITKINGDPDGNQEQYVKLAIQAGQVNKDRMQGDTRVDSIGEDDINCFKMSIIKQMVKQDGILSAILAVQYQLLYVVIMISLLIHLLPAMICYIWVWLSFICGYGCIAYALTACLDCFCGKRIDSMEEEKQMCFMSVLFCCLGMPSYEDCEKMEDGKHGHQIVGYIFRSPFGIISFVVMTVIIPCLSTSYWYLGDTYIDAMGRVLTERKFGNFIAYSEEQYSSMFRLFTTLF